MWPIPFVISTIPHSTPLFPTVKALWRRLHGASRSATLLGVVACGRHQLAGAVAEPGFDVPRHEGADRLGDRRRPSRSAGVERLVRSATLVVLLAVLCHMGGGIEPAAASVPTSCPQPRLTAAHGTLRERALEERRDVLGERLISSRRGPTYAAVRALLPPLWYALGRGGRRLTPSGAYYLTFAYPLSLYGAKAFALHVADGSQIVTRRIGGPTLTLFVGDGRERYGSCLPRLGRPRLARGWLPILRTTYVDARGVRYAQESFAGRAHGVRSLVSFVRLRVDATRAPGRTAVVRFLPSTGSSSRLVADGFGVSAVGGVRRRVHGTAVIDVAWVHSPVRGRLDLDAGSYASARVGVRRFWEEELAPGTLLRVPERRVFDAERSLLVQQRVLTWRYSVGNPYEELSFAEALDAARVMAAYGHADVSEAVLGFALRRLPVRYSNWRAGAVLVAAADQYRLTRDPAFVESTRPALVAVLRRLERQLRSGGSDLLDREQFSSDIRRQVIGLHGQAVAWHGLVAIAGVWSSLGRPHLATRAHAAATRLARGLRSEVRAATRRLEDGSLFVPAALDDTAAPFDELTASRDGSYWNLVMPYALASGLFPADGATARGVWRYMNGHGSRLLGLVRAGAARLYSTGSTSASGIDQVYGIDVARFLADADVPDELVLSLYGALAGSMTPGTFVSGEAATVVPLRGERLGSMYLPPNGGTSTSFLETLRVGLVHERRDPSGRPTGLELAFATPRAWLGDGKTIAVLHAPTSFGPVSYVVRHRGNIVRVEVDAPAAPSVRIRLRLPSGLRIHRVQASGRPLAFDRVSETIRLPSGPSRALRLVARVSR
jgi:hypothetical protein